VSFLKLREILISILKGYGDTGKRVMLLFLQTCVILLVSAVIVFPLWYFATQYTQAFTLTVGFLILIYIFFRIILKVRELARNTRQSGGDFSSLLNDFFKKLGRIFFLLFCIFIVFILYVNGNLAIAIPVTLLVILTLGYFIYGRKKTSDNQTT